MQNEAQERPDHLEIRGMSAWLPLLAILIVMFGAFVVFKATVRKEREVSGVVQRATWLLNEETGQRYPDFEVELDGDDVVRVRTMVRQLPKVGERVVLRKRRMLVGNTTYQWDGPAVTHGATPAATRVSLP